MIQPTWILRAHGLGLSRVMSKKLQTHRPTMQGSRYTSTVHVHGHAHGHAHGYTSTVHVHAEVAAKSPRPTSITQRRPYHSTPTFCQATNKEAQKAQPNEEELNETEETVPEWQNPLHHNNEDMQKMFEEDFSEGEEIPANPLPPFEESPEKVVAPPHVHDLAHQVVNLTLLELKELTNKIADHFHFDDEVMAASYGGGVAVASANAAPQEEQEEQKTIFDLKLISYDAKAKIKVIKEVRAIAGLGLKEAKELVEGAPKVVQKDLKQEKADELKAQLEAVGAQVEIV